MHLRHTNVELCAGTGFNADEGASLLTAFGGLQAESVAQGEVHRAISKELESLVVEPFEDWARGHKVSSIYSALHPQGTYIYANEESYTEQPWHGH